MPLNLDLNTLIVEGTDESIQVGLQRLNKTLANSDSLVDPSLIELICAELSGAYACAKPLPTDQAFAKKKDLQTMYNIAFYFMTTVADLAHQQGIRVGNPILGKILEIPTKILEDADDKYWYAKPEETIHL